MFRTPDFHDERLFLPLYDAGCSDVNHMYDVRFLKAGQWKQVLLDLRAAAGAPIQTPNSFGKKNADKHINRQNKF